jgi:phenol hydroxylase P1 protein
MPRALEPRARRARGEQAAAALAAVRADFDTRIQRLGLQA